MMLITGMQRVHTALRAQGATHKDRRESSYEPKVYDDVEQFEAFCVRLQEEKDFRDSYTNFIINEFGSPNVGEVVRGAIRSTMTDALMLKYNRTGRKTMGNEEKRALPPQFRRCIKRAAQFHHPKDEVRFSKGGRQVLSTVEKEVETQMEIYLSNTRSRIKRKANKARSRVLEEPALPDVSRVHEDILDNEHL